MLTSGISGKIHVLPGDVVSRIAAGEVVERPSAVVKELVENSLDAGSRSITVEVKHGGLTLIRVTDDGEGMCAEDAARAFERHATSKLCTDHDLWALRTMGFRGEALPSIASVSTVRLLTAPPTATIGTMVEVSGGVIGPASEAPPIAGTRIDVADLFYNQPARKKFLKSAATEFSHISRVVQQTALAWPAVHFRLVHNGQDVMNYPSVPTLQERIGQVYRTTFLDRCVPVDGGLPMAMVRGWTIDAVHATTSRTPQELFVNQRPVRNSTVLHAVTDAYGSFLPKGHHPSFVLFLQVDADRVDVNVHPAKREVRFSDQDMIHQLVRGAIRQALGMAGQPSVATVASKTGPGPCPGGTSVAWRDMPVPGEGASGESLVALNEAARSTGDTAQLAFVSEAAESYVRAPSKEVHALGQVNRTFLIVEIGGDLTVLDQHTVHERVLFERLSRAWTTRRIQSQALLIPRSLEVSASQAALLGRHRLDLEQLGLDVEPFGPSTVMIRAVPLGIGSVDPDRFLWDLLDDLEQWDRLPTMESRVQPVLASLACHGAVRAGRSMELAEIKALVEDWITEGAITTCPHGRRTVFRLRTQDLERMFGRAGW